MSRRPTSVLAFVDWNSQLRNAGTFRLKNPDRRARCTLKFSAAWIGRALISIDPTLRYRVRHRLYHGWHRGLTPTENRRFLDKLNSDPDFRIDSIQDRVVFETPFEFGDRLLSALPHRLRQRAPQIHLPDTCRDDPGTNEPREKMVDTAMAADLLVHARSNPEDWRIVLAEDDDLIPPMFTAEFWSKPKGGRTILLRQRATHNPHIDLQGLLVDAGL